MRKAVYCLVIASLLSSCGLLMRNYTQIIVGTAHIKNAEREGDNSYYTFQLQSPGLQDYLLQVTLVDGGKTAIYGDLVHPGKTEKCLPLKRPKWKAKEKMNPAGTEVDMYGKLYLSCEGKKYQIQFSYQGPVSRKVPVQTH